MIEHLLTPSPAAIERHLRRLAAIAVVCLLAITLIAGKTVLVRTLHEMQPASAWMVVESLTPVSARIDAGERLVWRLRGRRYRPGDISRMATLWCRSLDSGVLLSTVWQRVGYFEASPIQRLGPAAIGYDDAESLPEALDHAERLPGFEVWPGKLPITSSECELRAEWRVVTSAGAEHVITATSTRVLINAPRPLEAADPEPVDTAPDTNAIANPVRPNP